MIGENLYGLTPRDDVSLLQEVRDFRAGVTFPNATLDAVVVFSAAQFTIPKGRVAIPIGAGCILNPTAAVIPSQVSMQTNGAGGTNVGFLAGSRHVPPTIAAGSAYNFSLSVEDTYIIRGEETLSGTVNFLSAITANCTIDFFLRVLLIPKGTIGV